MRSAPPYLPPAAHLLQLAPLNAATNAATWGVVLACSLAPLVATQAIMTVASLRYTELR